jgi:two-component system, OmpR family, response regulator
MVKVTRPLFAREYAHYLDGTHKALPSGEVPATLSQPHPGNSAGGTTCQVYPDGARMNVLVVEDHADGAATTARLLRLYGYEARVAVDGHAALAMAREAPPDVILLDIGLPGIDGYEVARLVRRNTRGREPFIVAISGYGRDDDRRRAADAGIDLYLLKPVEFHNLQPLLKRFEGLVLQGA